MPNSLAVVGSQMDLAHQRFPERAAAAGLVVAVLNLMKGLRGRNGCPSPQKLKLESGELAQLEAAASAPHPLTSGAAGPHSGGGGHIRMLPCPRA